MKINIDCSNLAFWHLRRGRGGVHLLALEALYIHELEPKINTKDEWWSRTLTIQI